MKGYAKDQFGNWFEVIEIHRLHEAFEPCWYVYSLFGGWFLARELWGAF
jgi:hypothetical protein